MFELFKKSNNIVVPQTPLAANALDTKVRYNPELISQFVEDHKSLLSLFSLLNKAANQGNFTSANKWLRKFTSSLRAYLLTKNLHLFVYLQHAYKNDLENLKLIKEYKREMHTIGRGAGHLLSKYNKPTLNSVEQKAFVHELDHLGQILKQQLDSEEAVLYPLYTLTVEE